MIGTLVGPYRIVELLGKGGVGEVYRAYHQETSRDVAIKILAQAPDAQARARFAREAEALRDLRHPGIIEIVSVGEFEGRPYYTMPFVRVLSLADLIHQRIQVDRGRFSQDEILRVVVDVARALRYAHGRGVVHRDVKPGNILVDQQFRPILCDFGLARTAAAETVTRHGTMVGTPRYMAPEQLQGRKADWRSDLYSLGLVAYEMAAGVLPLDGGEPLAAAIRRLTEPVPPIEGLAPQLSPEFARIIGELLQIEPRKRPASTGDLVRALEAIPGAPPPLEGAEEDTLTDRPVAAPAPAPGGPTWTRFVPIAAILVGVAGMAVFALAGPVRVPAKARCTLVPESDRATLTVDVDRPAKIAVRYGSPGRLDGLKSPPGGAALSHRLVLDPLEPDREHAFALVFEFEDGLRHEDPAHRFRTGPRPEGAGPSTP